LELGPVTRVAVTADQGSGGSFSRWCHGVQRHLTTFGHHQLQLHIAIVENNPIGCRPDQGLYLTRLNKRARVLAPAQPTPHEKHKDGPREPRARTSTTAACNNAFTNQHSPTPQPASMPACQPASTRLLAAVRVCVSPNFSRASPRGPFVCDEHCLL